MDEQKIDRQVNGAWVDMFGYKVPGEEGARWSRLINTHLAQQALSEPRFIPLATVPMQDGVLAAEVLREAHGAGFKGAMIGTQPKGVGGVLDDPALNPVWEAADACGAVICIHPVFESGDNRVQTIVQKNVVREVKRLGAWRGRPTAYRLPPSSDDGLKSVVIVQAGRGGRVLGVGQPRS